MYPGKTITTPSGSESFLNFGAVPGTLFIYFVISLTIHTLHTLIMYGSESLTVKENLYQVRYSGKPHSPHLQKNFARQTLQDAQVAIGRPQLAGGLAGREVGECGAGQLVEAGGQDLG